MKIPNKKNKKIKIKLFKFLLQLQIKTSKLVYLIL